MHGENESVIVTHKVRNKDLQGRAHVSQLFVPQDRQKTQDVRVTKFIDVLALNSNGSHRLVKEYTAQFQKSQRHRLGRRRFQRIVKNQPTERFGQQEVEIKVNGGNVEERRKSRQFCSQKKCLCPRSHKATCRGGRPQKSLWSLRVLCLRRGTL